MALHRQYAIAVVGVLAGCLLVPRFMALVNATRVTRRPKDFHPGPATIPVLENLQLLPTTKSFLKQVWHAQHCTLGMLTTLDSMNGEHSTVSIIGLKLSARNCVILSEYKHVLECVIEIPKATIFQRELYSSPIRNQFFTRASSPLRMISFRSDS